MDRETLNWNTFGTGLKKILARRYIKSEYNNFTIFFKSFFHCKIFEKKKIHGFSINSKNLSRWRTRQIGHVLATITGSNVQTKTPVVPRVRARQASGRTLPANLPGRTSPCPNIITRLDSVSNAIFDSFAGRIFPGRVANCFHSLHEYRPPSSRWKLIDTGALSLSLSDRRSIFADFLWGPCLPTFHSSWYRYVRATVCTILAKFVEPVILINLLSGTSVYFSTRKGSVSFLRVFQTRGYRFFFFFFFL